MIYEDIELYYKAANYVTLSLMYMQKYKTVDDLKVDDLKKQSVGHLGTSLSMNFILANLYYYLAKENLTSQIVIGTGHSGVSLLTNLWLSGILQDYYEKYSQDIKGLNNLLFDFGKKIRTEINPEYPQTIYDGGELGYSLGVAYGYALNSNVNLVPCIIGDGEAETGTLMSSWQLNNMLNVKCKVLPIINLNGLKMGSKSFLSTMEDKELIDYFNSLGYEIDIIDTKNKKLVEIILEMQNSLKDSEFKKSPLIIFRSSKGFTLPDVNNQIYEGQINVHKDPLSNMAENAKLNVVKNFLLSNCIKIFDEGGQLLPLFEKFKVCSPINSKWIIKADNYPTNSIDEYLYHIISENDGLVFSPDEIYSNRFRKSSQHAIEILNENILQALLQGYVQSGGLGYYIGYEGFMPIISSMISQYYKYLNQKEEIEWTNESNSLNYILTSTCWENTYSHQNPSFVNELFAKPDSYYNIVYPKDAVNAIKCLQYFSTTNDMINVLTFSKRHEKIYQKEEEANITIEVFRECENPELILCATGDYMLDRIIEIYESLKNAYNIKIVYVSKPQILSINSKEALSEKQFANYFNCNVPILYLFNGYSMVIKSLLFERDVNCTVLGYNDRIAVYGNLNNNLSSNGLSINELINLSESIINNKNNISLKRRIK